MRLDRWRRLDAFAIRQELLEEWGLTLTDGSSGPPLDRDERVAAALVERDEALATAARLEEELAGSASSSTASAPSPSTPPSAPRSSMAPSRPSRRDRTS